MMLMLQCLLPSTPLWAQELQRIYTNNYLSQKKYPTIQIRCLAEDKDGFIWAGTINGLYRFDAHGYEHFKGNEKDSMGLCENYISALYVTKNNELWIGTERKGVVWFDKSHHQFVAIKNDANKLNNITPSDFVEDHQGNIWFANKGGASALGFIDRNSHALTYYSIPEKLVKGRGHIGQSLSIGKDNHLFIGTTNGLVTFNMITKKFETNFGVSMKDFVEFTISQQYQCQDGSIWMSLYGFGLVHYYPATKMLLKYQAPKEVTNGSVMFLPYSKNEFLVYAGRKNISIFNTVNGMYRLLNDNNSASQEGFSNIYALIQSKEKIIFFGGSNGLFALDPKNQPSRCIHVPGTNSDDEYKLNSLLYNPKDSCIYAGLFRANNYSILKWHKRTLKQTTYRSIQHFNLGYYINKIMMDKAFNILGSDYTHLYKIDKSSSNLQVLYEVSGERKQHITDFFIDHQNNIWLALSLDGLVKINNNKQTGVPYYHEKDFKSTTGYTFIGEDNQHQIWVAYQSGISSFNTTTNTFTNYVIDNPHDIIKQALLDTDNTIWLTKYGKGIYHFNPAHKEFKLYGENDGLGSNLFNSNAIIISKGNLYTLSNTFLTCLNTKTGRFQNYSDKDLNDFNAINPNNTFIISDENEFITATNKGIIISNLNDFRKSANQPHAFVNSIKVWGKDWTSNQDLNAVKSISLEHDQNYLSLGFSSLSFRQDELNKYSYYLDGFDKEWHTTTTEKQVTYTSLPSGTYIFNLKASNYAGYWDAVPKQISITIYPPFWKTWWFIISVLFLINLIAYAIVRNKINRVKIAAKLENKHNLELIEFELKALKAQINPHFLFNALNAIQQQIFTQNTKDAHKYLGKFAKLLRSTLDLSDRRSIQLVDEIELLNNYLELEKVRFKNKFSYSISVSEPLMAENPEIPGMIVQPYVENAIIHGLLNLDENKVGELNITFNKEHDVIQCTITDNGVGRIKAAEIKKSKGASHASKGIAITESRIKLISKLYNGKATSEIIDLTDIHNEPSGTQVILQIPIH